MKPDDFLDVIEPYLRTQFQGDSQTGAYIVVRAPEGIVVLGRDGNHILIQANTATLEVTG